MENSYWDKAPERFLLGKSYHLLAPVVGWDRAVEIGMRVWEEASPPSRLREHKERGRAGRLYIPKSLDALREQRIVSIAGIADARRLISHFPGESLEFPCIEAASTARRNRAIVEEVARGTRREVIACLFGLSERQVGRIVAGESTQRRAA